MCTHNRGMRKAIFLLAAAAAFLVIEGAATVHAAAPMTAGSATVISVSGAASTTYGKGIVRTEFLNVRAERNTTSKVLYVLTENRSVTLLEKKGNWYKIKINGQYGWISGNYLEVTPNATTAKTTKTATTTKAAKTTKATKEAPTTTTEPEEDVSTPDDPEPTETTEPTEAATTAKSVKTTKTTKTTAKNTTASTKKTTKAASAKTTATTAASTAAYCTVKADYLYVRSGPGTDYMVIGGIANGRTVSVMEVKGAWVKVQYAGSSNGWVSKSYVTFTDKAPTKTTAKKTSATTAKTTAAATKKTTKTTKTTKKTTAASQPTETASETVSTTATAKKTTTTAKKTTTTTKKRVNAASGESVSSTGKIIISADLLNARAGASTSSKIVATVRHNEVYSYSAIKDGWFKIKAPNGQTSYVNGEYVKIFSGYAIKGGGSYLWPTQTGKRISSPFGPRDGRNHYGIDIAVPGGSQIMAVAPGRVTRKAYEAGGFGYYVVIQQNDGISAYYGHMMAPSFLKVGATVKAGDTLGMVGSTGHSTGNHLHLEFRRGSTRINPINYYPNMR
ncbi:MAG: SH3 domain-containing protein [Clostridia bacterium]|nr:SH3 domain-containing protein [Clostridia bacterium]